MYSPNDDTQNYPFCRLHLEIEPTNQNSTKVPKVVRPTNKASNASHPLVMDERTDPYVLPVGSSSRSTKIIKFKDNQRKLLSRYFFLNLLNEIL